ncbi:MULTISPECIES: AraC family transcriptional regulator [unclassified Pseudomonas]|uniref:helix-turn-helix transcriptional regulator n=1 Tax=unclassified Pseudomonas TaxID=196821 RepID=UPI003132E3B7
MLSKPPVLTYGMRQRSDHLDFYIRDQRGRPPLTQPHRHEYFQIQINLGGDTLQHIGGAVRPFPQRTLAFILPHRLHLIPHPAESEFLLLNFSQHFFLPHVTCDPLDLEDLSTELFPELAPFRFQEHLDFQFSEAQFNEVHALLDLMRACNNQRSFGSVTKLRGYLLQLIGLVCEVFSIDLQRLASTDSVKRGRRDALGRVRAYINDHLHDPAISLKAAAAAAFLSPNYLTHLLRKETGKPFSQLLLERRMQLARTLLLTSNEPVGLIATACGFADESYFSRCFRKAHGLAPGQFRREKQAAN